MIITSRFVLTVIVLLFTLPCQTILARSTVVVSSPEDSTGAPFSWNLQKHQAPFIRQANSESPGFAGPLVYSSGDFSLPLLQALDFESSCDCYSLMVSKRGTSGLEIVHFWRAGTGFYRSGKGPYLELEKVDSLRSVTALNGTRFLFAQVGDGEWRCVSIHDSLGNYLLLDYRADGLIGLIRDSFLRTATPAYTEGRMISLTQTWITSSGAYGKTIHFIK